MKVELFSRYIDSVQARFGLSNKQMFAKNKRQENVDARQMLYLLCERSNIRVSYIKRYMEEVGHKVTHTTIIHGIRRAKQVMKEDKDYATIVSNIEKDAV